MDAGRGSEPTPVKSRTTVERKSEREVVVKRTFDAPARLVFEAWTRPELLKRWWVPKSFGMSLLSYEADIRAGGTYRFVFRHGTSEPMAFYGRYLEVTPHARLVWTNEEAGDGGSVTTVTFEENGGKTRVVVCDLYPSKEAFDASSGAEEGMPEQFDQLDELLASLRASVGRS
ncbi:MAG TPA: SRPBCC family protein [Myxococcales bacterium]|nr:SRPBCC family protein [Myxococcales bacterium]